MYLILYSFWQRCPALLFALAALAGCAPTAYTLILGGPLLFPLFLRRSPLKIQASVALSLLIVFHLYCRVSYTFPDLAEEGAYGEGEFQITSLSTTSKYGKRWCYKGTLLTFIDHQGGEIAKNIPCTILLPFTPDRPTADWIYSIRGTLKSNSFLQYRLKTEKNTKWAKKYRCWSLVEWRATSKQVVKEWIFRNMKEQRSSSFLAGIATGEFEDQMISFDFGRFGLKHIMAISGFHFAIIATFCAALLRLFLPVRPASILLIVLITTYFLFLGCGPSIIRAWMMAIVGLIGATFGKEGVSLNSLGIGVLIILMTNPLLIHSMGFQLSCITTASILLFTSPFDALLQRIYRKRLLSEVIEMEHADQLGYCMITLIRKALALMLAVNITAIPMMLYHFHKFPLFGLLFNLFFPFMVSVSILLLMISALTSFFLSPLSPLFIALTRASTHYMLNLTSTLPISFDYVWNVQTVSPWLLILYLILTALLGIYSLQRTREPLTL